MTNKLSAILWQVNWTSVMELPQTSQGVHSSLMHSVCVGILLGPTFPCVQMAGYGTTYTLTYIRNKLGMNDGCGRVTSTAKKK